ncbi:MAG: FAD-dependent monooxygenase [Alphaproteobacteria bacterium]|nr:FAD-dependent monooxygenase [Alphaproteobacteria bacterium]
MTPRTIGIAGCGVAGLACAALMARSGARVVVHDRLETPQPLGSGLILQPVGLAVLDAMGVGDAIRALGAPIERLFGKAQPSGRVVLDVRYRGLGRGGRSGLAVHRGALFDVLYRAAIAAGAEIAPGREVAGASDGRFAFADGKTSAKFDLVIDALGMRSVLSRAPRTPLPYGALWASLDWPDGDAFDGKALEQRYERARKMVGVLPIGRLPKGVRNQAAFFWSLRHEDREAWMHRPLDDWKGEVLDLWPQTAPLLQQIWSREQLVFATYAHRTLGSPIGRGVVHVGDSWHCTSPQLGQGANMALLDAFALARALESVASLEEALGAYAQARLWHIRLYQMASWAFTPAYQSDGALYSGIRDWIMAPLSRTPPVPGLLAGLVAGVLGSPLTRIEALAPQALSYASADL